MFKSACNNRNKCIFIVYRFFDATSKHCSMQRTKVGTATRHSEMVKIMTMGCFYFPSSWFGYPTPHRSNPGSDTLHHIVPIIQSAHSPLHSTTASEMRQYTQWYEQQKQERSKSKINKSFLCLRISSPWCGHCCMFRSCVPGLQRMTRTISCISMTMSFL